MRQIVLIAHNLRSAHNVGSLIRTAEGLGLESVYLTGYTPYPRLPGDQRLPHLADRVARRINKTALGAEELVDLKHEDQLETVIALLKADGFRIIGLEQTPGSLALSEYRPAAKIALVVGREVEGLEAEVLNLCDQLIEIPMLGSKESFNVAVAAAMALYHLRFMV